jgi:uncharacterized coiled-coil protein SlyX
VSVSLAAIKELNKRVKDKDARIAALEAQLKAMNDMFSARLAKLEEQASQSPQFVTAYAPTAPGPMQKIDRPEVRNSLSHAQARGTKVFS